MFRPSIVKLEKASDTETELTWASRPGDEYTLWSRVDLVTGAWVKDGTTKAEGPWTTWLLASGEAKMRFFRIGWTE